MFKNTSPGFQYLYSVPIFVCCLIALALLAQRPPVSYDSYWHLKMGQDLLEYGFSPWVDHYSFTYQGKEITTVPVLFQIVFAYLVSVAGEEGGFYSLKLIYIVLIILTLFLYFKKINARWYVIFLVMPFVVYFVNSRLIARPEIFSNVLIVVSLILYINARKHFAAKQLLYICLLLLFWVNYHSPIIGYIIIFGLFLDKAIELIMKTNPDVRWEHWLLWGMIIFAIGAINPKGHHFLLTNYSLLTEDYAKYTKEYLHSYNLYSSDKLIHIFWAVSIYLVIWSLYKKQFGFALICAILTYFSWSTIRLVTPAVIVNVCIFSYYLSQISPERFSYVNPSLKKSVIGLSFFIALFAYYSVIDLIISDLNRGKYHDQFVNAHYPVQVTSYLKKYHGGGNILNLLSQGGYLIYHLSPKYKVYIDGRTNILYPIEFLEHWIAVYTNTELLKNELNSKNIQYAIYKNTTENILRLSRVSNIKLIFSDNNYLLFSRNGGLEFPVGSRLYVFPMCWNDEMLPAVKSEISLYNESIVNEKFDLGMFYNFINGYIASGGKSGYLRTIDPNSLKSETVKRLGAYMALKQQEYDISLAYFDSIARKSDYDLLMMANLLMNLKKYDLAEKTLYYLYSQRGFVKITSLPLDKAFVFMNLMGKLQKAKPLTLLNLAFYTELQNRVKQLSGKNDVSGLSLQLFAPYCETFH